MGTLIPKLFKLLKKEYNLHKSVKKDVEFLLRELPSMQVALRKVAGVPRDQLDEQVKLWADEIRELSYAMEDVVDDFLTSSGTVEEPSASNRPKQQLLEKMGNLFTKGKTHHQIAKKIKDMKILVKEVADRRDRYKVNDAVANLAAATRANNLAVACTSTTVDPRLLAMFNDPKGLVGLDVARNEITKKLLADWDNGDQQPKIVSIVGSGGLGKTTVAKVVHDRLQEKFVLKAFVSVGQKPDMKKVLRDILLELDKEGYRISNAPMLHEKQLIEKLHELLGNKRYFIVIDDIWDVEVWKIIRCALKDGNCGSRIITTTRILDVAKKSGEVYQLKPLSPENSEKLFYTRLCDGKSKCPFGQSGEITGKILQKCGGVPLAILTIASLLDGKPRKDWSKVYESIGFGHGVNKDVDNTRKILLFSYYDLPYYLRTCLLHLSIYPEDSTIRKTTLIWKWAAEGFIKEEPEIGQYEIGERYFKELLNRSMIQPVEDRDDVGVVLGCRVHDLVLDMICLLSKEQNFVTILDTNDQHISCQSNARRLAVQKRVVEVEQGDSLANMCTRQVRSFNATACDVRMMPLLSSFRALRVLAMESCTFKRDGSYHLEHLGSLIQLRYLGLESMPIDKLPEQIGKLKFLETLNLSSTEIKELPQSIGLLRQLKCLNLLDNSMEGIGGLHILGNLTSLEELSFEYANSSPEIVVELGKLTELRDLDMTIYNATQFDDSMVKALVKSLGKLQKLQILNLFTDYMCFGSKGWEGYVPPPQLRELSLSTEPDMLPAWINPSLLPNLTRLSVTLDVVKAQDMEILGSFPELVSLTLEACGYQGFLPDVTGGCHGGLLFPKLRYLGTPTLVSAGSDAEPRVPCVPFS